MAQTVWSVGDSSGSQTLTGLDSLYESHVNELRVAANVLEGLLDPDNQTLTLTGAISATSLTVTGAVTGATGVFTTSTGNSLLLDQNGNGIGLNIDSEATSADSINIDAVNTSGSVVDINLTPASSSTANLLTLDNGANSTGDMITINNNGTGTGIILNQVGVLDTPVTGFNKFALHVYTDTTQVGPTGLVFFRVLSEDSYDCPVLNVHQWSDSNAVWVYQKGKGRSLVVDNDNNSNSFAIDQDVTDKNWSTGVASEYGVDTVFTSVVDDGGTYTKTGTMFGILSEVTETSGVITDSATVLGISQTHAHASGKVVSITNEGTGNALYIDQNGDTASEKVVSVVNAGTGNSLYIDQNADTGDSPNAALQIENTGNIGIGLSVYSNIGATTDSPLTYICVDNTAFDNAALNVVYDGADYAEVFDNNGRYGMYIDHDCTVNDVRTWALKIASDNAGTGTALGCGIDMSTFSVDEPLLKAVADAITTPGTLAGQIAIDIGGTTYYLEYRTHGS